MPLFSKFVRHPIAATTGAVAVLVLVPFAVGPATASPAIAAADAYGDAVRGDGPSSFWRLDESSGTAAKDEVAGASGTYSSGVVLGEPASPAASAGTSIRFPGDSAETMVADTPLVNPTVFSLETWFRTTTTSGGRLIGFGSAHSGTSTNRDRHIYMLDTGQLRYGIYVTAAAQTIDSPDAYNDGQWHHVVATQGPDGEGLYVDGALVATGSAVRPQNYTGYWRLGTDRTWGGATTDSFAGSLDEAAVYPSVLSPDSVQKHYELGAAPANIAPKASFTSACTDLECTFDGSDSADGDGGIASYAWDFGDGKTDTGVAPTHRYAAAGRYPVVLKVTDNGGATGTFTATVEATDRIVASDTFTRTVASGLGSAEIGGPWTVSGSAVTTSVAEGSGRLQVAPARTNVFRLNSTSSRDTDLEHLLWLEQAPTGSGATLYTTVRSTATGDYRLKLKVAPGGVMTSQLVRVVNGTETALTSLVTVPGGNLAVNQRLRIRVQAFGATPTTLRAKIWSATGAEPEKWLETVTDSTAGLQEAGSVGLVSNLAGNFSTSVIRIDDWIATERTELLDEQ